MLKGYADPSLPIKAMYTKVDLDQQRKLATPLKYLLQLFFSVLTNASKIKPTKPSDPILLNCVTQR